MLERCKLGHAETFLAYPSIKRFDLPVLDGLTGADEVELNTASPIPLVDLRRQRERTDRRPAQDTRIGSVHSDLSRFALRLAAYHRAFPSTRCTAEGLFQLAKS